MPSTAPIISAECARSIGSKKIRCRSPAISARSDAAKPAVNSASTLTKKMRVLLYAAWRSTATEAGALMCDDEDIRKGGCYRESDRHPLGALWRPGDPRILPTHGRKEFAVGPGF